jgi:hypothetical protein
MKLIGLQVEWIRVYKVRSAPLEVHRFSSTSQ